MNYALGKCFTCGKQTDSEANKYCIKHTQVSSPSEWEKRYKRLWMLYTAMQQQQVTRPLQPRVGLYDLSPLGSLHGLLQRQRGLIGSW